jgi:hypothetical protein
MLAPHPALLCTHDRRRYLIVTDLHLGFEANLAQAGVHLRPTFAPLLDELRGLVRTHQPHELVILGDVKASTERFSAVEWELVPRFFAELLRHCPVSVIPGNHDGALEFLVPSQVQLLAPRGLLLGRTALLHGHTRADPGLASADRFVIGHAHPVYSRRGSALSGQRVWVRLRAPRACLYEEATGSLEIVVMPVFNRELALSGMAALRSEPASPILRRIAGKVDEAAIITLDGTVVGGLEALQYVLGR